MPIAHVRLPAGRFDADARRSLAERLTSDLLAAEGLKENSMTRSLSWVMVEEMAPGSWTVAAKPVDEGESLHAFVRLVVPQGSLSEARKAALVATVNTAVVEMAGGDPLGGMGVWVVIEEIVDGNWGVAGGVIRLADLKAFAGTQ